MDMNTFHKLSYGVYVVITWDNGRLYGQQRHADHLIPGNHCGEY